jgi:hypothetical protein
LAALQRTHAPKYVSYYGDGSGRDHQIISNNGGLTSVDKYGMGNAGIHMRKYHGPAGSSSPKPNKSPSTYYY